MENLEGAPPKKKRITKNTGKFQKIFADPLWPLAKFIIDKFLDIRQKNPYRDNLVALRLAKKYNSKLFWANLPCEFRVKNLSVFAHDAGAEKLKMYWIMYINRLNIDKKLEIAPKEEYIIGNETIGSNIIIDKKPKTIYEFCK